MKALISKCSPPLWHFYRFSADFRVVFRCEGLVFPLFTSVHRPCECFAAPVNTLKLLLSGKTPKSTKTAILLLVHDLRAQASTKNALLLSGKGRFSCTFSCTEFGSLLRTSVLCGEIIASYYERINISVRITLPTLQSQEQ